MKKSNLATVLSTAIIALFLTAGDSLAETWQSGSGTLYVNPTTTDVGIGTTSPGVRLDVSSTTSEAIRLNGNTGASTSFVASYLIAQANTDYRGRGLFLPTADATANNSWFVGVPYTGAGFQIGNSGIHTMEHSGGPYTLSSAKLFINPSGNVGIGTTSPTEKLAVVGNIDMTAGNSPRIYMGGVSGGNFGLAYSSTYPNYGIYYLEGTPDRIVLSPDGGGSTGSNFVVLGNGNVGIGTRTPDYKLDVLGTIRATEVKVATGWSDFVFDKDYSLRSLDEVKSYIEENKHLPDVPSAKEIQDGGLSVAEMMTKQMQKIEELTLYVIEQKKQIDEMKEELAEIKKNN
jgi:hypothetical protein